MASSVVDISVSWRDLDFNVGSIQQHDTGRKRLSDLTISNRPVSSIDAKQRFFGKLVLSWQQQLRLRFDGNLCEER